MQKGILLMALIVCFGIPSAISQESERWYYNVNEEGVALDAYDVVAYHTSEKATIGKEDYKVQLKGLTYYFASSENQALFKANPEKYLPAYGGWCTFIMGIDPSAFPPSRAKPDPENFIKIKDRVYLFRKNAQQNFKAIFQSKDQEAILKRADTFWASRLRLAKKVETLPKGMNPMARMELLDWYSFMGDWSCELTWWADTTGQQKLNYTGKWYFRYGYYGYCIQDDFVGDAQTGIAGTAYGPAIRGYDPGNQEWHMTYIPVNQARENTWMMRAKFLKDGLIQGTMELKDPYGNPVLQRVQLEMQGPDKFIWSADWSYDQGKTWKEKVGYSVCTRLQRLAH